MNSYLWVYLFFSNEFDANQIRLKYISTYSVVNYMFYFRIIEKWNLFLCPQIVILSIMEQHIGGKLIPVYKSIGRCIQLQINRMSSKINQLFLLIFRTSSLMIKIRKKFFSKSNSDWIPTGSPEKNIHGNKHNGALEYLSLTAWIKVNSNECWPRKYKRWFTVKTTVAVRQWFHIILFGY